MVVSDISYFQLGDAGFFSSGMFSFLKVVKVVVSNIWFLFHLKKLANLT